MLKMLDDKEIELIDLLEERRAKIAELGFSQKKRMKIRKRNFPFFRRQMPLLKGVFMADEGGNRRKKDCGS